MGVVVDANVLIRLERARETRPMSRLGVTEGICVSVVAVSELRMGIAFADSDALRARRERYLASVLDDAAVLAFTIDITPVHAGLGATLRRAGMTIGVHDLIIAATALHHGHDVLTANSGELERVPGLRVVRWVDP